MKKFKISQTAKPKIVKLDGDADVDEGVTGEQRPRPQPAQDETFDLFDEEAAGPRVDAVTEASSLKKGGLVFLGGARPQSITGASQLMEEMVAVAEAKKQEAPKSESSDILVFVTAKYEEQLRLSGRTREATATVPAEKTEVIKEEKAVEIKEENFSADLKTELERKIREAQERYFMRKNLS